MEHFLARTTIPGVSASTWMAGPAGMISKGSFTRPFAPIAAGPQQTGHYPYVPQEHGRRIMGPAMPVSNESSDPRSPSISPGLLPGSGLPSTGVWGTHRDVSRWIRNCRIRSGMPNLISGILGMAVQLHYHEFCRQSYLSESRCLHCHDDSYRLEYLQRSRYVVSACHRQDRQSAGRFHLYERPGGALYLAGL